MITRLEISGFKTFDKFQIEFAPFVVIAGANGSGKSNLFDAIKLLAKLATDDIQSAFQELRGDARELFTQFPDGTYSDTMSFVVELLLDDFVKDSWGGEAKLKYTRLRYELEIIKREERSGLERLFVNREELSPIKKNDDQWYKNYVHAQLPDKKNDIWRPKLARGRTVQYISTEEENTIITVKLHQDGDRGGRLSPAGELAQTVLSGVSNTEFPHAFAVKEELKNWRFLQLNPIALAKPSPMLAKPYLGSDGSNMPATLARMKSEEEWVLDDIGRELNKFLPNILSMEIEQDYTKDQYLLKVKNKDGRTFSSRVLSEGTLRLIALCTLKYDHYFKGVLCFEEPENGIHPFRLKNMVKLLQNLSTDFSDETHQELPIRQIIVNTHSPAFVKNIFDQSNSSQFSILYASLISRLNPRKKQFINYTKLVPVSDDLGQTHLRSKLGITSEEQAISKTELMNYLSFGLGRKDNKMDSFPQVI